MSKPASRLIVRPLTGETIHPAIDDLARLRIEVFRDFPYLYDGSVDYERRYLSEFAASDGAVLVVAFEDDRIVGASTGAPMAGQKEEFRAPFEAAGFDAGKFFYFGESVLLPEFRGRGIGHAFFDQREGHARAAGATHTTFCAVVRPEDHPVRPADYEPLDSFWIKRGYQPVAGLTTRFAWKDIGASAETEKPMQFWVRQLD